MNKKERNNLSNFFPKIFSEKGMIISVDSMIGMTLMLGIIVAAFFYTQTAPTINTNMENSFYTATSLSAIIEKNNLAERAISENASYMIKEVIEKTPERICVESKIEDSNGSVVSYSIKSNCTDKKTETAYAERTIVTNNSGVIAYYTLKVGAWIK